jgi:CheY-like chemotaxis protein
MPTPRVLVVDDDSETIDTMCAVLASAGFYVAGACGGQEAIEAATADPPDVVLVDLVMPEVDGFEVARRLRQGDRPPVLVATGRGSDWDRERAEAAGFSLCLTKPIPPKELIDVVRKCVQARGLIDPPRG